ncbi:MAG: hypothetical protein K8T91_08045 [Planctomycetes bacterium]|nr:hypothetical protein [Planctomycetota bacterium]
MLIGPVFSREASTAPRRSRHFVARATYVAALVLLIATAWMVLAGTQVIRNLGDLARFGGILFQVLAPLQLALVLFFSALFAASAVSQEKDRQTLLLLLMSDLKNSELVLGKLLAALLFVMVLLVSALPVFMGLVLLGGVEVMQVVRMYGVTLVSAAIAGSLGSTMALWREKTFQALALTALILFVYLGAWEALAQFGGTTQIAGLPAVTWAAIGSPWRAVLVATEPMIRPASEGQRPFDPVSWFLLYGTALAVAISGLAIARVRIWNPTRELRPTRVEPDAEPGLQQPTQSAALAKQHGAGRHVWNNPVAWREMRTWAYGRKIVAIRLAYVIVAAMAAAALFGGMEVTRTTGLMVLVPLFLISLVLVNAQAVTALTTERDGRTLDLLLVTDLTPREFIFGKLGGVLYNAKEMVLLPLLICLGLWWRDSISAENTFYIVVGLLVMDVFVAVLGIHCGLIHENSRVAVGTSLGTVFFLFIGVAICMRIMVAFGGTFQSFQYQLPAFLALIFGGGVGLYVSLGARNASTAIFWAAFSCPFLTFWAITSFLLDYTLAVFLVMVASYGFTTATMLIPALSEFDVASGRSNSNE